MKGYPQRYTLFLYCVLIGITFSGLLLVPTFLDLYLEWDMRWRASGSQRLWIAATHTGFALAFLLLAGSLWAIHMRAGWRRKRQHVSGMLTVLVAAVLTVSCVGIFYAGDEDISWWSSSLHVIAGLVAIPVFASHRLAAALAHKKMSRLIPRHFSPFEHADSQRS